VLRLRLSAFDVNVDTEAVDLFGTVERGEKRGRGGEAGRRASRGAQRLRSWRRRRRKPSLADEEIRETVSSGSPAGTSSDADIDVRVENDVVRLRAR
jgi:hypothetical protein